MIEKVEVILKHLDVLIRGGSRNRDIEQDQQIENLSRRIFEWASSAEGFSSAQALPEETKSLHAATAVKLHNKARTLAPSCLPELRAMLKAVSGWLLYNFHPHTPKAMLTVIKLVARSAQDLRQFEQYRRQALVCSIATGEFWSKINEAALSRTLPPLELQDVKHAVFQSFLDTAVLILEGVKTGSAQQVYCNSDARRAVSNAMEIVQSLKEGHKIFFAESLLELGSAVIN